MELIQGNPESGVRVQVDLLKGFKSDIGCWQPPVNATAQYAGHRTNVYGFRHPGNSVDFLPEYRERAQEIFCGGDEFTDTGIPRVASAHSLGAFLLMELLTDDETASAIAERYDAITTFNGFLGSQYKNTPLRERYANWFRDAAVGTTWIERRFSRASKEYETHELPTHAQGLMFDKESDILLEKIFDNGGFSKAVENTPITFVIGNYDTVCDNDAIRQVAGITGARVAPFNVNHNAMMFSEVQNFFVQQCGYISSMKKNIALQSRANTDMQSALSAAL